MYTVTAVSCNLIPAGFLLKYTFKPVLRQTVRSHLNFAQNSIWAGPIDRKGPEHIRFPAFTVDPREKLYHR